jgi:hypothetical protein
MAAKSIIMLFAVLYYGTLMRSHINLLVTVVFLTL